MKKKIETLRQFLDELQENIANLIGGFYGVIVMEGDIKDAFHEAPALELKKQVIKEAQDVVTNCRIMIEEATKTNKDVGDRLRKFPDDGKKHAVEEHLKLRERVLVDIEAYIISLESQINELKNEI